MTRLDRTSETKPFTGTGRDPVSDPATGLSPLPSNTAIDPIEQADLYEQAEVFEQARWHLTASRARLFESIRTYPTPITGCDQQFNHLLEQREHLSAALRRLEAMAGGAARPVGRHEVLSSLLAEILAPVLP